MGTSFVSNNIWPSLTRATRIAGRRAAVAVAYFGAGASRLLPLARGSRLVVDASERTVASGQTCPADLEKLSKRGVVIYSVPNLHAKAFALGRVAFIGSTNASNHSARRLVEAVVRTTEPGVVRAVREFVEGHCLRELTPGMLKRLRKLYRPPKVGGRRRKQAQARDEASRPTLPRLFLAQLVLQDWSDRDLASHNTGMEIAKKRRRQPRKFELDSFGMTGRCPYRRDDVVVQVTDEGSRRVLVTAPGNVLHVRTRRYGNRQVSFVYLERPALRRRRIGSLAKTLSCTQKKLRRDGLVRDMSFARTLLNAWTNRT